jgi:hypothetical protein
MWIPSYNSDGEESGYVNTDQLCVVLPAKRTNLPGVEGIDRWVIEGSLKGGNIRLSETSYMSPSVAMNYIQDMTTTWNREKRK